MVIGLFELRCKPPPVVVIDELTLVAPVLLM